MYKIMLADDEGIVIDSLTCLIEKNFGKSCVIKSAKTGRAVIQLAEEFRPDIAIMDIHMPGINGIEAMKEIKSINNNTIFIVMSAYDKFTYAKECINLGVLEYLTKPTNQGKIVAIIEKAISITKESREKREYDLIMKEKLETVVPIIESGLIYTILFQDDYSKETGNFKELLGIEVDYGFMLVIQYQDLNDNIDNGSTSNPVGVSVKAQSFYLEFREIIKEFFDCVVGPIMVNQVVIFIPYKESMMEYNERIRIIENTRNLIRKLKKYIDFNFRAGIGSVKSLNHLTDSYKEVITAMRHSKARVIHVKDISSTNDYEEDDIAELEKVLLRLMKKGDVSGIRVEAFVYFDWLVENSEKYEIDIMCKLHELIIRMELEAYLLGVTIYHSKNRGNSLKTVIACKNKEELRAWFIQKVFEVCSNVSSSKEEQSNHVIKKAILYIENHYNKDISLDDVSREVDISPYYFSRLFKEETKENFIEYLTKLRIKKAKELLKKKELSMKHICLHVGFGTPNYFSRIFKKYVGVTPTEYREEN